MSIVYRGDLCSAYHSGRAILGSAAQRLALWMATFLCVVFIGTPAHAEGYRAYGSLEGTVGIISGVRSKESTSAPGFQLEFGAGPKSLPITLGIAAGLYVLDYESLRMGSDFFGRPYYASDSLELRHVEAVVRLQPDWPMVRPFASASVGYAGVWFTRSYGDYDSDVSLDGALVRSASVGLDLDPWTRLGPNGRQGSGAVAVTIGVRGTQTSQLNFDYPDVPSGSLRILSPFIALTVAGWS